MSTAATTKQPQQSEASPSARKIPPIQPSGVTKQYGGFCWSEWEVRLPDGVVFGDLNVLNWTKVQGSADKSVRKGDRVRLVAFDESWIAEAIVSGASGNGASLCKPTRLDYDPQADVQYETPEYKVTWTGNGYNVVRKSDGLEVAAPVQSKAIAEKNLGNMYRRPAA